jgi:predicted transcriptional regulator
MAARRMTATLDRPVKQRPIAKRMRRGLPIVAMKLNRDSSAPCAPATFSPDPAQIVLGHALAARVTEATRLAAEAAVAAGLTELASGRFAKSIYDLHKLATRAIARFLVTGQGTSETERNFICRVGVMAAVVGLSVATLNQSYLMWRDSNLRVLNEEVRRLGTSIAVYDQTRKLIRSSAETGFKRMVQAYQEQMEVVGHPEDCRTVALRRPQLRARAL